MEFKYKQEYLDECRADVERVLATAPAEVPGLLEALREGRIDGHNYVGDCACLVGTIAKLMGIDFRSLPYDPNRPAERWFGVIRPGMTPSNSHTVAITERWLLEWLS